MLFLVLLTSFIFNSCEADIDIKNISEEIALHPDFVIPVFGASVSFGDILLNNYDGDKLVFGDNQEINYVSKDSFEFDLSSLNLPNSVTYGNFDFQLPSTTFQQAWNVNKHFRNGLLKFSDPKVDITLSSNIGTYLNFKLDYIKAFRNEDPTLVPVYAWFDNHTINSINEQLDKPKSPGLWITKTLKTLDKDYGEMDHLFVNEIKSDKIEYKLSSWIDQSLAQKDPTKIFITPDARIKVNIRTTIPFQLNEGSYYDYIDTVSTNVFKFIDNYAVDRIDTVAIVMKIKNGLPVTTQLSLNFLDSNGIEIKTGFEKTHIILSGKVDMSGIVQFGNETNQTFLIPVTNNELSELRRTNSIVYTLSFEGESAGSNIHFNTINTFDMKLGLYLKGDLKVNSKMLIENLNQ